MRKFIVNWGLDYIFIFLVVYFVGFVNGMNFSSEAAAIWRLVAVVTSYIIMRATLEWSFNRRVSYLSHDLVEMFNKDNDDNDEQENK